MIRSLAIGRIHGKPLSKVAPSGRRYCTATLIADNQPEPVSINLIAFEEMGDQLAAHAAHAHIGITGRSELTAFLDKNGIAVGSLRIVVDSLIALEKPTRRKSPWPYAPKMKPRQRAQDLRKIIESEQGIQ